VTSPAAVEEFLDVVSRPRLQRLIEPAEAEAVADLLRRTVFLKPAEVQTVCRDPSDDYLLALAVESQADALVTRDEDLLLLRRHGRTEIIHVAAFLARIAAASE